MKQTMIKLMAILSCCALFSCNAIADATITKAASFKRLQEIVTNLGADKQINTLVVMDNDDTLTMMSCPDNKSPATCQYLGGPAWFGWQQSLQKTAPTSPFLVASEFDALLEISDLLFAVNYMVYTDASIPAVLATLSKSGVRLLVETARGPSAASATSNQFEKLPVKDSRYANFMELIDDNALLGKHSHISAIASPYQPCRSPGARPTSYQQGVFYAAGQNKGNMLKCFLQRTESSSIENIVFIDDTLQNVEDVANAFENSRLKVIAIHYTALSAHKAALTKGDMAKKYQDAAHKRWQAIKKVLTESLLSPAIPK